MNDIQEILQMLTKDWIVRFYMEITNKETGKTKYIMYDLRKLSGQRYKITTQLPYSVVDDIPHNHLRGTLKHLKENVESGYLPNTDKGFVIIPSNELDHLLGEKDHNILYSMATLLALANIKKLDVKFNIDLANNDDLSLSIKSHLSDLSNAINNGIKPFL